MTNKLDALQENIDEIGRNSDWFHIHRQMQRMLDRGSIELLTIYLAAVIDTTVLVVTPPSVADALQNIRQILIGD
jgi:hypothetical protein